MGSRPGTDDEVTVLVTGFGPFKAQYPINPSWEIARSLPTYLPGTSAREAPPVPDMPPVRILFHPEPIRVNYRAVRGLVPSLWRRDHRDGEDFGQGKRIDVVIHIGMAGPQLQYSLEKLGHRDGYGKYKDVDNEPCGDEERREKEGSEWVWDGCPDRLETDFDTEDVLRRWRKHCPAHRHYLKMSTDAGHFLCDFIYFSSLAYLYKRNEQRRVVFLHVPSDGSEEALERGREVVVKLIRSLVESELEREKKDFGGAVQESVEDKL